MKSVEFLSNIGNDNNTHNSQATGAHCTCDVAETQSLATAVTSAVASAAASCCSVFGSGAMSAVVPDVAACTDCCMYCPHLLIIVLPQWYPLLFG
jgi:hypothetical protein